MYTQLYHDPFGRFTVIRKTVHTHDTCAWCGNTGKQLKNGLHRLFMYGFINDGIYTREEYTKHFFCSKSCHANYIG